VRAAETKSATRALIEALYDIRIDDLTAEDLMAVRSLFLDYIGVTAAGAGTETAQVATKTLLKNRSDSRSQPLIGTDIWAGPIDAAFANAVAGHCLEFDDTHSGASLHPGVVVFSAALAATDLAGATSSQFVEGVITGYELMCRVGRAVDPAAHYRRHFHPTATTGYLAAAVTAARIFGLNTQQTSEAVGVACTMAAGSLEFLSDGAWTKRLHPGLAVRNGLFAAQLVSEGFRGPRDGIAGTHGFLATYTDKPHPEQLLEGLGRSRIEIRNTSIKAHGCCRYNQGPIDAVLEIRARESLRAADVQTIRVGVVTSALTLVWNPPESKRHPTSVVDAQFSLPYSVAIALSEGRANPSEFAPVQANPELQRLMDSVECIADAELDRHYPDEWRCWVEITASDGRIFTAQVNEPKGEPGNPFSAEELYQKVAGLTAGVYSTNRLQEIAAKVAALPDGRSMDRLVRLLATDLPAA
jgi:2-methylcitrate dehydratase PrpD